MDKLLDGKSVAAKVRRELKEKVALTKRAPGLTVVVVGDDPASNLYVSMKQKAARDVGMKSEIIRESKAVSENHLLQVIDKLNQDPTVDGILVQLPLPSPISPIHIVSQIDPEKDVDGLHPLNQGKLLLGETSGFVPCTPLGIQYLLTHYEIETAGKHLVILGRSNIVGKPLAALMMQKADRANATVTILHSRSRDIPHLTRTADILVTAMGRSHFIGKDDVKPGSVIIDVGINRDSDKLTGDVDFHAVLPIVSKITPVPGGIGPMTIAMLLSNTWTSYSRKE